MFMCRPLSAWAAGLRCAGRADPAGVAPPLSGIAARAIAVPGMLFTALCLATGSIWVPTWGTWREWDYVDDVDAGPAVLYAGSLRWTSGRGAAARRITAARRGDSALVGAINIPIINRAPVVEQPAPGAKHHPSRSASTALLWPLGLTLLGFRCYSGRSC